MATCMRATGEITNWYKTERWILTGCKGNGTNCYHLQMIVMRDLQGEVITTGWGVTDLPAKKGMIHHNIIMHACTPLDTVQQYVGKTQIRRQDSAGVPYATVGIK